MASRFFSFFLLSLLPLALRGLDPSFISVTNGALWGEWGEMELCPQNFVAYAFAIKVQEKQGFWRDDSSLNGIRLFCRHPIFKNLEVPITSSVGQFGQWSKKIMCTSGYLTAFSLKVEPYQGPFKDDTAANNIKFRCSNNQTLEGPGGPWGSYGIWSQICHTGVCGISNKVEKWVPIDYTGLNDSKMKCCK
ncbi:vitelline membrane outer layer protein 1 homolog [Rhinophrynus dorsalis]